MNFAEKWRKGIGLAKLVTKRLRNTPDTFELVSKDEQGNYLLPEGYDDVSEVGQEVGFSYPSFHDALPASAFWKMTELTHRELLDANAVYIDHQSIESIGPYHNGIFIQPLKLEEETYK